MRVYVPIAIGQVVPHDVLASLGTQTVRAEIVLIGTEGMVTSRRDPGRYRYVAATRRVVAELARAKGECAVICDSDIVQLRPDNLEAAEKFLLDNQTCGAVAMFGESHLGNHVVLHTVVIPAHAWPHVDFGIGETCTCRALASSLAKAGLSMQYVDDKIRVKEIPRPGEE